MSAVRPAEAFVHGVDAPCVVLPGRVAAVLLTRAGLADYHRAHRGNDPEVDQALVALKLAAAAWRSRTIGSDHRTRPAADAIDPAPSPQWLSTNAAAQRLGVTARAITKAINSGRLPARWWGGCWWLNPHDVEHYRSTRRAAA